MWWVIALYLLNTLVILIIAIREACRPIRALTWVLIGALLPVIGFLVYFALSLPLKIRRPIFPNTTNAAHKMQLPPFETQTARTIASALERMTGLPPRKGTVQPLTDGRQTYDALFHALRGARQTIDLEYYIYRDDHVGRRITDILIDRSLSGVQVRFLRDGWGSRKFPSTELHRLAQAGVICRTFFPVRFPWVGRKLNHRDHCKIVVVDGETAFVGGINVGDEYTGHKKAIGPWRDTHLYVEGDCVRQIRDVFLMNWRVSSPENKPSLAPKRPVHRRLSPASVGEWAAELDLGEDLAFSPTSGIPVQTVESGPDRPAQSMRNLFFLCLTQASKQVDITTPYFLPDSDLIFALKTAILRGVRIRLLVPLKPDHQLIGLASRTYYPELLEAGVRIHQYQEGVLHAKVMVVDEEIAVIGAANYDLRSFRLNFEVATVMYSSDVAAQLTAQFERDLARSVRVSESDFAHKSAWTHSKERGARLLSPLL